MELLDRKKLSEGASNATRPLTPKEALTADFLVRRGVGFLEGTSRPISVRHFIPKINFGSLLCKNTLLQKRRTIGFIRPSPSILRSWYPETGTIDGDDLLSNLCLKAKKIVPLKHHTLNLQRGHPRLNENGGVIGTLRLIPPLGRITKDNEDLTTLCEDTRQLRAYTMTVREIDLNKSEEAQGLQPVTRRRRLHWGALVRSVFLLPI